MAGPLSIFRKYQYIFLVVFGVVLMVAFIVAPPLDDYLRSQSQNTPQGNPVVVESKYGKLREADLDGMRRSHGRAMNFLNLLVQEIYERKGTPRGQGLFTSGADTDLVHTYLLAKKAESMGLIVSDEAIVEFLEQLSGDIPPDSNQISTSEIGVIMQSALADGTPESYVLDQLRSELLAMRMRSMSQAGLFIPPREVVTPIHAWQYFKRLHRRVKAELVPFAVADVEKALKNEPSENKPAEEALKKLYETGKDRFPDPDRPEPGFKSRLKAAFQHVRFDFDHFLEAEKAKVLGEVTDEDIEQHYEQNKQRYVVTSPAPQSVDPQSPDLQSPDLQSPALQSPAPQSPAPQSPAPQSPAPQSVDPPQSEGQAAEETPGDAEVESTVKSTKPEKPENAESSAPPSGAAAGPAPTTQPSDEAPAERPPSPPKQEVAPATKPEESDKSSSRPVPPAGELFVSLRDDQTDQTAATEQPNDDKPVDEGSQDNKQPGPAPEAADTPSTTQPEPTGDAAETKEKPTAVEPTAVEPTAEEPTAVEPTAEESTAVEPTEEGSTAVESTEDESTEEESTAGPPDPQAAVGDTKQETEANVELQYRPLDEELREEIRNELAEDRAQPLASERLVRAKDQVRQKLKQVTKKYVKWNDDQEDDDEIKPFTQLKLEKLELDELAEAGQTPPAQTEELVDAISVQEHEIGRAIRTPQTFSWPPQQFPFYQEAFAEGIPMYSVGQTGSENGISYIYWKTTEEPEYVPDFAEAREQVEQAWRMAKALDVAKDDAAKLIARIEASGETLAEFFANNEDITKNEIIETNEFSWMSTGFTAASFGVPALSHVDGVESTGTEFMEAVFAMQPGEVGVAINQPQTIVYLVRIISETPSEDLLRQRFLQSGITSEIAYLSDVENFELRRKWYADLETEMGVVWLR